MITDREKSYYMWNKPISQQINNYGVIIFTSSLQYWTNCGWDWNLQIHEDFIWFYYIKFCQLFKVTEIYLTASFDKLHVNIFVNVTNSM